MLTVTATIRAQPQYAETLRDALAELAAASRKEPGCRGYRVLQATQDPALFVTFEQWIDADAEARHMASAHAAQAFAVAGPLLAAAPDIRHFAEI